MRVIYGLLIISFFFTACKSDSADKSGQAGESKTVVGSEKVLAVCISNGVPVRAEPAVKGQYLTSLNLGETMTYLGETIADSTNPKKEFHKVELSDGAVAWARTYGIILNGEPAAIMAETPIYKRPDLVNKTEKSFYPLEFIVIIGEKDDWVEVAGTNKRKAGWIKKKDLSTETIEVAVGTFAQKLLLDDQGKIQMEKAAAFLEELPYENSKLGALVQKVVDAQAAEIIEEVVESEEYLIEENSEEEI